MAVARWYVVDFENILRCEPRTTTGCLSERVSLIGVTELAAADINLIATTAVLRRRQCISLHALPTAHRPRTQAPIYRVCTCTHGHTYGGGGAASSSLQRGHAMIAHRGGERGLDPYELTLTSRFCTLRPTTR